MARRPRAFSADGTPKGHRAKVPEAKAARATTPAGQPAVAAGGAGSYALRKPVPAPRTGQEDAVTAPTPTPSANPISPTVDRLASVHTTPEQPTPIKPPPMARGTGDDALVERSGRLSPTGDVTTISTDLTTFSDSTTLVVAGLAVVLGALGLFTFGFFSGTLAVTVGIIAGLVMLLVLVLVMTDRLTGTLGLAAAVLVLLAAGVTMWAVDSPVRDDDNAEPFTGAGYAPKDFDRDRVIRGDLNDDGEVDLIERAVRPAQDEEPAEDLDEVVDD